MKEKKNEKASRPKMVGGGGAGSETSRTLLGETKQHASDNGKAVKIQAMKKCLERHLGK